MTDRRAICPKCGRRMNKLRAMKEEVFEWKGSRENGEYVADVGFYNEVHHCGGTIYSEVLQN